MSIRIGHGYDVHRLVENRELILGGVNEGLKIAEYTPLQVQQAVTGYGRADKNQVQQMTKALLGLDKVPKPDDTADALAIAICHAHTGGKNAYWQ